MCVCVYVLVYGWCVWALCEWALSCCHPSHFGHYAQYWFCPRGQGSVRSLACGSPKSNGCGVDVPGVPGLGPVLSLIPRCAWGLFCPAGGVFCLSVPLMVSVVWWVVLLRVLVGLGPQFTFQSAHAPAASTFFSEMLLHSLTNSQQSFFPFLILSL